MKKKIKNLILFFLGPILRSERLFRFLIQKKLIVFVFHDTSDKPSEFSKSCDLNTPPQVFKAQVDFLSRYFQFVHWDQLQDRIKNKSSLSVPEAMITFDDGYLGLFELAFPYLESKKIPSLLFINGEVFDRHPIMSGLIQYLSEKDPQFKTFCASRKINLTEHPYLQISPKDLKCYQKENSYYSESFKKAVDYCGEKVSRMDLAQWSDSKYLVIGSHLYHHFCSLVLSDSEFLCLVNQNRDIMKDLKNARNTLSAPFGVFNSKLESKFKSLGFDIIFGQNNGVNKEYTQVLNRVSLPTDKFTDEELIYELNKKILKSFL